MATQSLEMSEEIEERTQLERKLWAMTQRKSDIFEKSREGDEELNKIWKEEREIKERLWEIGEKRIHQEKRERHAVSLEKAKEVAELKAAFEAVTNENARLKQQVKAMSEREDVKYLEELQATLQRILIFSGTQKDELKRKEDEIDKLKRHIKRLEDKSAADREAEQRLAYETQLREVNELELTTNETTELKQTLSELHQQQQQPAEQLHHRGRLIISSYVLFSFHANNTDNTKNAGGEMVLRNK